MHEEPPRYLAYMLRLWQVETEEGRRWRASLESPHSGERHGFAGLEALLAFLVEKTETDAREQGRAHRSEIW
jgi:hypothetical protein